MATPKPCGPRPHAALAFVNGPDQAVDVLVDNGNGLQKILLRSGSPKGQVDLPPDRLRTVADGWEADLAVGDFQALFPGLATSPEGLEVQDVYALTIVDDAGLAITAIDIRRE